MRHLTINNFDCGLLGERDINIVYHITQNDILTIESVSCDIGTVKNIPASTLDEIEDACYANDAKLAEAASVDYRIDRMRNAA